MNIKLYLITASIFITTTTILAETDTSLFFLKKQLVNKKEAIEILLTAIRTQNAAPENIEINETILKTFVQVETEGQGIASILNCLNEAKFPTLHDCHNNWNPQRSFVGLDKKLTPTLEDGYQQGIKNVRKMVKQCTPELPIEPVKNEEIKETTD